MDERSVGSKGLKTLHCCIGDHIGVTSTWGLPLSTFYMLFGPTHPLLHVIRNGNVLYQEAQRRLYSARAVISSEYRL